ncbi:MAG: rhamnosyltransferase [Flavobacterium sp.]|jgi:rhamnosyltransferase
MGSVAVKDISVTAIMVTYTPDIEHLGRLIRMIKDTCNDIIVIDNGSPGEPLKQLDDLKNLVKINLQSNTGIGFAQNHAIKIAKQNVCTHIILFDQDSLPEEGMLEALLQFEQKLLDEGESVAAVGPQLIEEFSQVKIPFITFKSGIKRRITTDIDDLRVDCFSLLSSGTLIRIEVLQEVGDMNAALFLEYVDVEWGARARSKGFYSFGTSSATLRHNLGDRRIHLFGNISLPLHPPVRHYYAMRNAVFMQRQRYVPLYWKLNDFVRSLVGFALYASFNKPRIQQLKFMSLGILHGIQGKSGKFEE